jgi:hypothetical protein
MSAATSEFGFKTAAIAANNAPEATSSETSGSSSFFIFGFMK